MAILNKKTEFWREFYLDYIPTHSPYENIEQENMASNIREIYGDPLTDPDALLAFHPVNESGGSSDPRYGAKLNALGRLTGISDWVILEPRGGYGFALIELKRNIRSKSRLKPEQKTILQSARARGGWTAVAWGAEAGLAALEYYLKLPVANITKE